MNESPLSRDALGVIAQTLATELGEGWTATVPEGDEEFTPYLTGPGGVSLYVRDCYHRPGRVEVGSRLTREQSLHAHRVLYPPFEHASVTFDPTRLPKALRAVTGQVRRMLQSVVEPESARLAGSMAASQAYEAAQRANLAALGLEGRSKPGRPDEFDAQASLHTSSGTWVGTANVTDTHVNLDLNRLTVEQAKAILEIVRG